MNNDIKNILDQLIETDFIHNPEYRKKDDITISKFFADVFRDQYRYCSEAKIWYRYYDSVGIWKEDINNTVKLKAVSLVRALQLYGKELPEPKEDKEQEKSEEQQKKDEAQKKWKNAFIRWANGMASHAARENMLKDAALYGAFSKADMDKDRTLFNCLDGVFDLETGEILSHSPDHLFSKVSTVRLNGKRDGKRWEQFLDEIMQGDNSMIEYLQRVLGSCLVYGNPNEECYFIWGPTTRNGKTTLLETVGHVMGDYALSCDPLTFAETSKYKDSSKPQPDIADLKGARFIRCPEPPKGMLLDVATIKKFTGGNEIRTRTLNEKPFSFRPECKIFFDVNPLPRVTDQTGFSSNRLIVIPFERKFTEAEQDPMLETKLSKPAAVTYIFYWLYEGLKRSRISNSEDRPDKVIKATKDYAEESDKIGAFVLDCLARDQERRGEALSIKEVYDIYKNWCDASGVRAERKAAFITEMKTRKMYSPRESVRGKQVRNCIVGYRLTEEGLSHASRGYALDWEN